MAIVTLAKLIEYAKRFNVKPENLTLCVGVDEVDSGDTQIVSALIEAGNWGTPEDTGVIHLKTRKKLDLKRKK